MARRGKHLPAALVSYERHERVHGPDLWPVRCQAARLRAGRGFAPQYYAAPWARCRCLRRREQRRAQAAQTRRHYGLYVRDSLSAARYGLRRPIQIASEGVRCLWAPPQEALQPEAAMRAKRWRGTTKLMIRSGRAG